MSDLIEVGDTVAVTGLTCFVRGVVVSKPQATGDCWVIKEPAVMGFAPQSERIHHFQQFERITKEAP